MNIYNKSPLEIKSEIPIFSVIDEYVQNYEQIGKDVLNNIGSHGENPFMESEYWDKIENSTLDIINKALKKNQNILDVGVGLGRLLNKIDVPVNKYGIDIDLNQLKMVDKSINVCLSKVEDIPYKDDFFDVVVCTDVLEHVLDLNTAISNIIRCIKPGGKLIIRVPYKENLSPYLDESYPYQYAHLRNFDENNLQLLLEKIFSMKVTEVTYCGYINEYFRVKYFDELIILQKIITKFINFSKIFNLSLSNRIYKSLLRPVEINVEAIKVEQ
ncbi:MAG: class I SAM-dependent methyltransferase [Flavobacteriaceae bacterium]